MPSPLNHWVLEYQVIGAVDAAGVTAAVNALLALNVGWQPWGSVAVTTGAGDTHHQAMVRYGPELA